MLRRRWMGRGGNINLAAALASLLVASGCSSSDSAPTDLRSAFPDQADEIVASARGFDEHLDGYVLGADVGRWGPSQLSVALPKVATEPIRMRIDALTMDISVQELGLTGNATRDGNAIRYARAGGASYWAGAPGGVEEWLVLDDGVSDYATPVASWVVSGATLEQSGAAVIVYDASSGRPHIRVTADKAFGPTGKPLGTELRAVDNRIDLFVQESAGPVLIDPGWIDLATLQVARFRHAQDLLSDGTVLAAGGIGGAGLTLQDTAELYDPTNATWTALPKLSYARLGHTITTLDDGTAIVYGGEDGTRFPVYFPEIWDPTLNAGMGDWTLPTLVEPPCSTGGYHTATKLNDGRVLYAGGLFEWTVKGGGDDAVFCSELWDPMTDDYDVPTDQYMDERRYNHAAALLMNGNVLVSGGEDRGFQNATTEIFDVGTETWSSVAWMNESRSQHTLVTLCNGDVLAVGGFGVIPSVAGIIGGNTHSSAEVYDVAMNTWTYTTNNMSTPRYAHTASLLPDCTVLVVGGYDDAGDALASVEIYDPATDMFTLLASDPITGIRGDARATTLANGGILVSGGYETTGSTAVTTSQVFQSLLPNGQSCTLGGECNSGNCADGVCCDTTCDSDCEACTSALKGSGNDGACGPVAAGTDPDNNCSDQGLATCGTNGACDGTGVCAVYASGTVCNPGACSGDDVVNADTCNGNPSAPACVDNATTDCGAYTCSGAVCLTTCAVKADCAGQHYCDAGTGSCLPQLDNGLPAVDPDQCLSGFLADGVCCDAACDNGICDACTVAAGGTADGTCSDILTCTDDNTCTIDQCHPVNGCVSNNVLDGASCDGGICVAGTCIPDPELDPNSTGSGNIETGTGSGGAGATGSTGAAGDPLGDPRLEGGGICQATIAGGPTESGQRLWWLLLGVAPFARRRRRRG